MYEDSALNYCFFFFRIRSRIIILLKIIIVLLIVRVLSERYKRNCSELLLF